MKYKKFVLIAVLCVITLASTFTVNGETEGFITDMNVFTDYSKNVITVKLTADTDTEYINFAMINDNVEALTADSIKEDIVFLKQQSEMVFEIPVDADTMLGKWYTLRAGSSEIQPFSRRVYFPTKDEVDEFLSKMNTLDTVDDICTYLESNYHIAGLDDDGYTSDEWKSIAGILKNAREFDDMKDFVSEFYLAAAIEEINSATADDAEAVFQKYLNSGIFEIDAEIQNLYAEMTDNQKKDVMSELAGNSEYKSKDDLEDGFKDAVLLVKLNNARYDEFEGIIESYDEYMSLELDKYNKLTDNQKISLYKKLAQKNYNSIEAFAEELEEQSKSLGSSKNTGGGSGGSGGGGGGASVGSLSRPSSSVNVSDTASSTINIPAVFVQPESTVVEIPFDDIAEVSWAKDAIESLYYDGVLSGIGDRKFGPNELVTREQYVKMIVGALGLKGGGEVSFSDVDTNAWYYPYIGTAYSNGIISGLDNNTFGIGVNITREDIAVITMRAIRAMKVDFTVENGAEQFSDAQEISSYAREAVMVLRELGIMAGYEDNTFRPSKPATRAESAMIIAAVLELPQGEIQEEGQK